MRRFNVRADMNAVVGRTIRGLSLVYVLAAGWYLIAPDAPLNFDQPLATWQVRKAFGTAEQCESASSSWRKAATDRLMAMQKGSQSSSKTAVDSAMAFVAQCIASDDPRLKP